MNFLRRLTYRTEPILLARWLGLRSILRKLYFRWARPKDGILPVELAGMEGRFFVRTPAELRIIESAGGAGGEQQVVTQVMSFLKPVDVVFDIGANVGLYTVLLSKKVGDAGQVIAFEPEARTYEHLMENLKLNERKNVRCFRKALGERTGQASLFTGSVIGGGSLVHQQGGGNGEEVVEIAQGDELVATEKLPTPRAVKIDVEGYEYAVIQGLRHTLAEPDCEMLCCEIHPSMLPAGVTPEAVLSLVDSLGFKQIQQFPRWDKTFHIVARKPAEEPLRERPDLPLYTRPEVRGELGYRDATAFGPGEDLVKLALRQVCKGLEPETPEAMDHSHAQGFAIIPSYKQPRCLLPLGNARWTLNGLSMVQPRAWRWRVPRALLVSLVKTGWKRWAWESILVGRDQLRPLESIVGAVTGETKPVFAILVGRPGLYRKLTVQVMSPGGKILCYLKLPLAEAAGDRLQHEAAVLQRLGGCAALRGHIPEVLHSQEWQDGYVLFQSAGSGKPGATRFTQAHERFLRRLWDVRPVQKPGPVLVDEVGRRWQRAAPLLTPEQRRLGDRALQQAGQWLDGVAVRCGLMHGDFAAGNTFIQSDGELFVVDWELAEFDQPILWDVLNFHAVTAVIRQKPKLAMNWVQHGSGDVPTDKGLLRLYLVNSLCLLLKEGSVGRERAIDYRRIWLEMAAVGEVP